MSRKFGWLLLYVAFWAPTLAAANPGAITGFVKDATGVPQMGAMVEVLTSAAAPSMTAYTDVRGFFSLRGLLPGMYTLRVSAPSFLPTVREQIGLQPGANLVLHITLNTLFQAMKLKPQHSHSAQDNDDWRWTLRSMSNRPVLRFDKDGSVAIVQKERKNDVPHGKLAFLAGSEGEALGNSEMSTAFLVQQSVFGNGQWRFNGNVGYNATSPNAVVSASYAHELGNGTKPEVTLTAKRVSTRGMADHDIALQALSVGVANSVVSGPLEVRYGGEMQSIQFTQHATAFRPFATADYHLGRNTMLEYRMATSAPNMRYAKGFDTAPADLSESGPRISLLGGRQQVERAQHHEFSISQKIGKNTFQVALYKDRVRSVALNGVGSEFGYGSEFVPDAASGMFLLNGGDFQTDGVRAVYQRKILGLTSTFDYGFGGVLTLPKEIAQLNAVRNNLVVRKQHSGAIKIAGVLPGSKTKILTSYKWLSGEGALTPVDIFNASAGQTDPYLNLFIRQPIPAWRFLPDGVEVLVDVRNLLEQGYQPVLGPDGQTVYLVQTARSIRGGVAFSF